MSWDEYLKMSIHRGGATSASVTLMFSIVNEFGVRSYQLTRSWEAASHGVRESFTVYVNGERDDVLAEDWGDHIEGLLPLEIASLNFFDGEKTNELATPEKSREVIRSAIRGLLGLGILERLEADLKVLIRRKQEKAIGDSGSEAFIAAEGELSSLSDRRAGLVLEVASVRTQLERSREEVRRKEVLAREVGVERWEQRAEIEGELSDLRSQQSEVEQQLQICAAGAAPLAVVESLLARTDSQVQVDQANYRERLLLNLLTERDAEIVGRLPASFREVAEATLYEDRRAREGRVQHTAIHERSENLGEQLRAAMADLGSLGEVGVLVSRFDMLESRIADVERKLMGVPSDAQLAPVLEDLGRLREQADTHERALQNLEEELHHLNTAIERQESKVQAMRESEANKMEDDLQNRRSREFTAKALGTLEGLAQSTILRNIASIESAILDSFRQLVGKSDLISRVRLDPATLEMSVDTSGGRQQPIERLSAGERQLLAVAILWGLSRVSQRDIPLMVDTPLARLDHYHRERLAVAYLPMAARQVIILSTDEEFDAELYQLIAPFVSREYLLEFSDAESASQIAPGYFAEVLT
jgi:DNA sulfur modification protein DndD